jgi:hypothetical protein
MAEKMMTGYIGKKALKDFKNKKKESVEIFRVKGVEKDWMMVEWPPVKVEIQVKG